MSDLSIYLDAALTLQGLVLSDSDRAPVLVNFQRNCEIAQLLVEFELPDDAEPAPVFRT